MAYVCQCKNRNNPKHSGNIFANLSLPNKEDNVPLVSLLVYVYYKNCHWLHGNVLMFINLGFLYYKYHTPLLT